MPSHDSPAHPRATSPATTIGARITRLALWMLAMGACATGGRPFEFGASGASTHAFRPESPLQVGGALRIAVVGGSHERLGAMPSTRTRLIAAAARRACGSECDGVVIMGGVVAGPLRHRDDLRLLLRSVADHSWDRPQWHVLRPGLSHDDAVFESLARLRHSHGVRGHSHFWSQPTSLAEMLGVDTSRPSTIATGQPLRNVLLASTEGKRRLVFGHSATEARAMIPDANLYIGGDDDNKALSFDATHRTLTVGSDAGFAIVEVSHAAIETSLFRLLEVEVDGALAAEVIAVSQATLPVPTNVRRQR